MPTVDLPCSVIFNAEAFSPVALWVAKVFASLHDIRTTRLALAAALPGNATKVVSAAATPPISTSEQPRSASVAPGLPQASPASREAGPAPDTEGAVHLKIEGPVATITLDRPPVNAWSITMFRQAVKAAREAKRRPDVRIVILKAMRPRLFGVGGDIKAMARVLEEGDRGSFTNYYGEASEMFMAFEELRREKPLVTLARGTAVGGHLGLAMGGILVVSSDPSAKYAMPEIRLGMVPDAGATHRLPRRAGLAFALFMCLLGREISGPEARFRGVADVSLRQDDFDAAETDLRAWAASNPSSISPYGILKRLRAFEKDPLVPGAFFPLDFFNRLFASPGSYEEMLETLSTASVGEGALASLARESLSVIKKEPLALFFQATYNAVHLGLSTDARQTIVRDRQMSTTLPTFRYAQLVHWITVRKRDPEYFPHFPDDKSAIPHRQLWTLFGFNAPIFVHKQSWYRRPSLARARDSDAARRAWDDTVANKRRLILSRYYRLMPFREGDLQRNRNTFDEAIEEVIVSEIGAQLDLGLLAPADVAHWIRDLIKRDPALDERILSAFDLHLAEHRSASLADTKDYARLRCRLPRRLRREA